MTKLKTIIPRCITIIIAALTTTTTLAQGEIETTAADFSGSGNVIDEIIWVVGDEPILRSDVEISRYQAMRDGHKWDRDPDCAIPEQIAVQKLFLHQAALDSIEVTESEVTQEVDARLNYLMMQVGGREKLEEYQGKSLTEMRIEMHDDLKNQLIVQQMRRELVKNIDVTPAEVRRYFKDLPQDSIPFVPTTVEVQIITKRPKVSDEEINRIKNELRDYTERVTSGQTTFATLARLYSEDGSSRNGGELGFTPRAALDPAFANVAFNLTDPQKISKVVETEFGYHIIQLIEKRGERINVRHILRKPQVDETAITDSKLILDSLSKDIRAGKYTFDDAAQFVSDDKDTRNNHGLMAFFDENTGSRTSKFRMQDLPSEVARQVEQLQIGELSQPFTMVDNRGKIVCAIIQLKNRTESHRATMAEDFLTLKEIVLNKKREETIRTWIAEKIKNTYIRINERYRNCDFEFDGWVK